MLHFDHQKQVEPPGGVEARSHKKQILCAEGHHDTLQFFVIWLGLAGYEVTTCDSTAECIELAASKHFDLYLISDWLLDGSGFDLAEQIRCLDRQTPMILNSAQVYPRDIERGKRVGAQAFMPKPSDPERLLETISQLLRLDANRELKAERQNGG